MFRSIFKYLFLLIFFHLSSHAYSQGKTYTDDSYDYSFYLSDYWKDMPAGMEDSVTGGKKEKIVVGTKILSIKSLVQKDAESLTYPYVIIQLLGDNPEGSFPVVLKFAEEMNGKALKVNSENSKEKILNTKSKLYVDMDRKIVFIKLGFKEPDGHTKVHLTAMMIAGRKAFQLNFYSTPESFDEDTEKFFQIIDSFEVD